MNFISVFRNSDSNHSAYFRHEGSHFACEGLNIPQIVCNFADETSDKTACSFAANSALSFENHINL